VTATCSVFIATSLDGYVSRADGGIDWLERANAAVPPGEDCGYRAFFDSVDALVMGRNTFDLAATFDPWPYESKRVVVLTHRPLAIAPALAATVSASSEAPGTLVSRLSADGAKHLYVDGGRTIQSFLAAGLVDRITITTIPVLLGGGRPLFGTLPRDVMLELESTRSWPFGFVQCTWRVGR